MQTIIGIDPGMRGGITIIQDGKIYDVLPMPIKPRPNSKTKKNMLDSDKMLEILKGYVEDNAICVVEKQGVRMGEGSVSSFTTGEAFGIIKGIALGVGYDLKIVMATTWKKMFKEDLESDDVLSLREEKKVLTVINKSEKDSAKKQANKKEIEKLGRNVKTLMKKAARCLASEKAPQFVDEFRKVQDDGKAESVLIALYSYDQYGES